MPSVTRQAADVLVVGAGPTGMTAALALTRLGMRCRIVDKAAKHKQHSQAGVLWPRTQEVLASLGLLAPWQRRATHLHRVTVFGYGKPLGDVIADQTDSPWAKPMLIGQNETEEFLEQLCSERGCAVEREAEAVDLTQTADGVQVRLRHLREQREEIAETAWVLATDGASSTIRNLVGLPWNPHRFEGQHVYQVDAVARWALPLEPGHAYFFLHEEGYFGCVPLPDGYHRFFISESDSKDSNVTDPSLGQMQELLTHLSGFPIELSEPRWLSGKRYQNVITPTFRAGRVLLAGDAGKAVVPLNGQGMNTGIQDAYNLVWKLAAVHRGEASDQLLDSYDWERHANAEHLVTVTGRYFTHVTSPSKLQEKIVRAVGAAVLGNKHVQERYGEFASMLDISYRDSGGSFVVDRRSSGKGLLQAGDRAPDASVVIKEGLLTRSLCGDIFQYDHWTLLLLQGRDSAANVRVARNLLQPTLQRLKGRIRAFVVLPDQSKEEDAGDQADVLLDYSRELHQRYTIHEQGLLTLIRPDQHVAWMGLLGDAESLVRYLAQTFAGGQSSSWQP